jgi:hypothetical protein
VKFIPRFLFSLLIKRSLDGLRFVGIDATSAPIPNVECSGVFDAGGSASSHDRLRDCVPDRPRFGQLLQSLIKGGHAGLLAKLLQDLAKRRANKNNMKCSFHFFTGEDGDNRTVSPEEQKLSIELETLTRNVVLWLEQPTREKSAILRKKDTQKDASSVSL